MTKGEKTMSRIEKVIYALAAILSTGALWAILVAYNSEAGGSELKACAEIRYQAGSNQRYEDWTKKYPDVKAMCAGFGLQDLPEPGQSG